MQESIVVTQSAALLVILIIQFALVLSARLFSTKNWPYCYLIILSVVASLFTWKAIFLLTFLELTVALSLLFLSGFSLYKHGFPSFGKLTQVDWLSLILLAFYFLYASSPQFRPDQWSYHLLVSKIISNWGSLKVPVYYENVYFTGVYEYFFVLPRYFLKDDVLIQSFTNGFSFLCLVIPLTGLMNLAVNKLKIKNVSGYALTLFLVLNYKDFQTLASSKAEPLFLSFAVGLFLLISKKLDYQKSFLIGLLLTLPFGFKLTWLHFALAFASGAVILAIKRKERLSNFLYIFIGGVTGFLSTLPYYVKNHIFFDNIIHPANALFFKTKGLPEAEIAFWNYNFGRSETLIQYLSNLGELIYLAPMKVIWLLSPLILWGLVQLKNRRTSQLEGPKFPLSFPSKNFLTITLFFIILWPLFYRANTSIRFVTPLFAIGLVWTLWGIKLINKPRWFNLLLLVCLISGGSLEVWIPKIFKTAMTERKSFYANGTKTMQSYTHIQIINNHREKHSMDPHFYQNVILSDSHVGYFANAATIEYFGPLNKFPKGTFDGFFDRDFYFSWTLDEFYKEKEKKCIWSFLLKLDINYLLTVYTPFNSWPKQLQPLIIQGEKISENAIYLSPEIIKLNYSKCPI